MKSFTTRPATEWTAPSTTYQVWESTRLVVVSASSAESASGAFSTDTAGTTNGFTTSSQFAGVFSQDSRTTINRTGASFSQVFLTTSSDSYYSAGSTDTHGDYSQNYSQSHGISFYSATTQADSSRASSRVTSEELVSSSSIRYLSSTAGSSGGVTGTISVTSTGPSSTTRTGSGTTTTFGSSTEGYASTVTTGSTDGVLSSVFTTSASTRTTSHTSQWSSTWVTTYTALTDQATTLTQETTDNVTWSADTTTAAAGSSHGRTTYIFDSILQDTVFLMSADLASADYNAEAFLWSFSHTALDATSSTAGVFTDLFASTTGKTITVPDYRKFHSSSVALTGISISVSTGSTGTSTTEFTSSNGTSFETSTTVTASTTGSPGTTTVTATYSGNLSTTYSQSWSVTDVSSALSTWTSTTTTDTAQPPATASSTIFTHSVHVTGYETTSSAWTSTTTSSTWGHATSMTSTRNILHSGFTTTTDVSIRSTTTDGLLFSSFTTTGTGTSTGRVLLGSVSTSTTRVFSVRSSFTRLSYHADFHSHVSRYTTTDEAAGSFFTVSASDDFSATRWTEQRVFPYMLARPEDDNMPPLDEVRHQCHPLGHAGFGGPFTASALSVHVTTTQGLAAGSTFTDETLVPPSAQSAVRGVSFIPVASTFRLDGTSNAAATSLISSPTAITGQISVAITWTSTTTTGTATSDTATTSRAATHTLGVTSSISGTFHTAEAITYNSEWRDELLPYDGGPAVGGFVAGDHMLGHSYQVLARRGCLRWSPYTSTQSTAASTSSATGSAGSVSTSIAGSVGIVLTAENVITATWSAAGLYSIFPSCLHIPHNP